MPNQVPWLWFLGWRSNWTPHQSTELAVLRFYGRLICDHSFCQLVSVQCPSGLDHVGLISSFLLLWAIALAWRLCLTSCPMRYCMSRYDFTRFCSNLRSFRAMNMWFCMILNNVKLMDSESFLQLLAYDAYVTPLSDKLGSFTLTIVQHFVTPVVKTAVPCSTDSSHHIGKNYANILLNLHLDGPRMGSIRSFSEAPVASGPRSREPWLRLNK